MCTANPIRPVKPIRAAQPTLPVRRRPPGDHPGGDRCQAEVGQCRRGAQSGQPVG